MKPPTIVPMTFAPPELIDLNRYPLADIESGPGHALARRYRVEYQASGLCILPGLLRQQALAGLAEEAKAYPEHTYFCDSAHNVYLTDKAHETDRVGRHQEKTFVGSVPYDRLPQDSILARLYRWDPLMDFIGFVLGKSPFYRFADPFGACSVNVFVDGGRHGWHFDESEYTVTLMLQAPDSGGEFEYVARIRGLADERERVGRVVDGDRGGVEKLPFAPGTLLIFGGRQTLHRVTPVHGARSRLVGVLCYAEQPDKQNSEAVRKLFWGRANPDDVMN